MKTSYPHTYYIYGAHSVLAALENPKRACHGLYFSKPLTGEVENAARGRKDLHTQKVAPHELDEALGENAVHQGIALEVSDLKPVYIEDLLSSLGENECVVILDQITDPQNVGAIMRSAAAFGASAVIQQDKNAPELSSAVLIKATSGASEVIPLINVTNISRTMAQLKENDFWCIGLDETGPATLPKTKLNGRVALVMGREGKGLRDLTKKSCDVLTKLPTSDAFSTLNVSNACAVALYEWHRQTHA